MTARQPQPASTQSAADAPVSSSWIGYAALLLTATLWALNGPLIKLLSGAGASEASSAAPVSPVAIACYRSLIGGVLFLPLAWRNRRTYRETTPAWLFGSLAAFTIMTYCFVSATAKAAASTAIILQYTSPLWVFLLAPLLLRERIRLLDGSVLLLAMAGVAIIFFGSWSASEAGDETRNLGLLLGLASGFGYGSLTVALRGLRNVSPWCVVTWNFLGSGLVLLPAALWEGQFALTAGQWVQIFVLGVVQFALPYAIFSWALQRVEARHAALIVLLEPILNAVFTWLAIGEPAPGPTLIGGPLILLSVIGWMVLAWRRSVTRSGRANAGESDATK